MQTKHEVVVEIYLSLKSLVAFKEHLSILFELYREFMFVCTTWQNLSNVIGWLRFCFLKEGFVSYSFFATAYADSLILLGNTIYWPRKKSLRANKVDKWKTGFSNNTHYTAQKIKFFFKYFFGKCDQIRSLLRIWSHLLKKSFIENFIFCAVLSMSLALY